MTYADNLRKFIKKPGRPKGSKNLFKAIKEIKDWKTTVLERLFKSSRNRALKDEIEHSISLKDIIIPVRCPVFNVPFEKNSRLSASIDRVDNSKGYIPGNIQVISRLANTMKNDASNEELLKFADWIKQSLG